MAAITGAASLEPTLAAAERGATVALANKECLVCAGALFMRKAANAGATVLPVDSEHNAVFQALGAGRREDVRRIVLTASGGPFRTWSLEAMRKVTVEQALKHPTWSMGPKITIDSATLMNKGLELIEAHHLFAQGPDVLHVVVHPQSVIHGMVEFRDGSVVAQLGSPDMRIPISHCLAWPVRMGTPAAQLDLARVGSLTFEEPDMVRFPALALARRALAEGGADALLIETMSDLVEASLALRAARETNLPVWVSFAYDSGRNRDRTMMGVTPEQAARRMTEDGAAGVGANCGVGIAEYVPVCRRLRAATPLPLWIKPNAGIPELVDGQPAYRSSAEQFAARIPALLEAGANIVGGCCGAGPEFIRAAARALARPCV